MAGAGVSVFWQPEDNISAAVAITKALTIIQVPWNARVDLLIAVSFIVRPSEFSIAQALAGSPDRSGTSRWGRGRDNHR